MRKVKILHIAQAGAGGVERFVRLLISNLDRSKFENIFNMC